MKYHLFCFLSSLLFILPTTAQHPFDGNYLGYVRATETLSGAIYQGIGPKHWSMSGEYDWYHETRMRIKGDTAYITLKPLKITRRGEKIYSPSAGGFYTYHATLRVRGDSGTLSGNLISTSQPRLTNETATPFYVYCYYRIKQDSITSGLRVSTKSEKQLLFTKTD